MSVRLKFALALAALLAGAAAALAALIAGVRSDLGVGDRSVLDRILREEAALAVGVAVLFGIGLGVLLASAFRLYVLAPRRLAEGDAVIASANLRMGHGHVAGGACAGWPPRSTIPEASRRRGT